MVIKFNLSVSFIAFLGKVKFASVRLSSISLGKVRLIDIDSLTISTGIFSSLWLIIIGKVKLVKFIGILLCL